MSDLSQAEVKYLFGNVNKYSLQDRTDLVFRSNGLRDETVEPEQSVYKIKKYGFTDQIQIYEAGLSANKQLELVLFSEGVTP